MARIRSTIMLVLLGVLLSVGRSLTSALDNPGICSHYISCLLADRTAARSMIGYCHGTVCLSAILFWCRCFFI